MPETIRPPAEMPNPEADAARWPEVSSWDAQRQKAQRQKAQRQKAQRQKAQRQKAQRQKAQRQKAQRQKARCQLDPYLKNRGYENARLTSIWYWLSNTSSKS